MPDIRKLFADATLTVKALKQPPRDEDQLQLNALYRQATLGDVRGERAGFADVGGGATHDAWAKLRGMSTVEAMQKYIARVKALKESAEPTA